MTKHVQRFTVLLSLLVLTLTLHAQTPATQPAPQRFFWKITSPTTEVYFLGSIHVATDDMYPLPPEIEKAYKDSQSLVVEADVTKVDQMTLALQVMQMGMYSDGDTLDKHISPDSMKALMAFCSEQGLPADMVKTMKPVMAAMTVEALFMQKLNLDADKGIDMHFLKAANQAKDKKIVELESADFQLKLLFSIDDKLAESWLTETLKDSSKDELDKIVKAWNQGDDKSIVSEMVDEEKKDPNAVKMNDLLIYQRNIEMTKKIEEMLKGTDKVFVVVGAAHLVGDKGVLKALEAKGYKVERPALTAPVKP